MGRQNRNTPKFAVDQVNRLVGQTILGSSASIINSTILTLALWRTIPTPRIILWLVLTLIINLFRLLLQLHFRNTPTTFENILKRKYCLLISLVASGCVWGSAGIFLFPDSSVIHQAFIAFILGGMVAGSVGVFASIMTAFYAFSVPTVFPIILNFFYTNNDFHFTMGSMCLLFWFIMLITARRFNRETVEILRLKYENLDLISDLEKEVKERRLAEERLLIKNQNIESIVLDRTAELTDVNKKLLMEIEERKEIERALGESEAKYRELVNTLPQVVFETDNKGNITFSNRNAHSLFGYTEKDFDKSLNIFQILFSNDNPVTSSEIQGILNGIKSDGNRYNALKKDGSKFPIAIHTVPVIRKNSLEGMRGIIIDLTEQKRIEAHQKKLQAQLQQAQKMEALGTMAGGVAHDLNNILSGIVSYPDLILMDIPKDSPMRKPIQTMQSSGKKAAAIVQDLLTLTRRGIVTEEVVNLNNIISEYLLSPEHNRLMSYFPEINIKTDIEKELLNILGSPVHLTKCLMNLISNAAEALPEGGEITISTCNRYVDKPIKNYDDIDEGDYVILSVTDNGIGISSEDMERIFEPFFTKKVMGRSGTGLGMAVVWGTVRDHKGYIDIQSSEGKGSIFRLYFPVTRKIPITQGPVQPDDVFSGDGETILLVDDVKDQREIASSMLSRLGYSIITVSSGEKALTYLQENRVDLIILDMIMDPGMDGLDTYRKILEIHPDQKAVIASGFSETHRVREAIVLGAGGYIKKPYTLEKLSRAVRKELDKQKTDTWLLLGSSNP